MERLEPLRTSDPAQYFLGLGAVARESYWVYLTEVLGLYLLDPWLHGEEIAPFIEQDPFSSKIALLPRGAGKTTAITVPLSPWLLAKSPLDLISICNAREDKAAKMARSSATIIQKNERYQWCFPQVKPSKKWGENGYYVDISEFGIGDRVDPSIGSLGTSSNITGSHINGLILHDDLINKEIARHPNQIRAVEEFFRESLNCIDPGTPMVVCGTRWTYFDFYGKILEGEIVDRDNKPFKVLKMGITREDGSIIWPTRTYVDISGKERQCGYTHAFIQAQRKIQGAYFSALYYNEPVIDADRQLDVAKIKTFKGTPFFPVGQVYGVGVEVNASQGAALKFPLFNLKQREGRNLRILELRAQPGEAKMDKHDKLRAHLQDLISEMRLNVREDLMSDRVDGIGRELRDFPKGRDDCLDALVNAILMCKESPPGRAPLVYIAVDPAFSIDGDFTAIIAVTLWEDEFYVLDQLCFRTDRTDVLVRQIFRMADRWNSRGSSAAGGKRMGLNIQGPHSDNKNSRYGGKLPARYNDNALWALPKPPKEDDNGRH